MSNPFRCSVSLRKLFSVLALTAFCTTFMPLVAFAQSDFDFSDDSGSGDDFNFSDDAGGGDDFNFSDGGDDFNFSDTAPAPKSSGPAFVMPDGSKPINFVFFEPVDGTPQKTLDSLTEALVKHLSGDDFAEFDSVAATPILDKLNSMDENERFDCVSGEAYATCVSNIVRELGVTTDANVVIGRIYTDGETKPRISLELIEVTTNTSKNFIEFETQTRLRKQENDLGSAAYSLYNKSLGDIKDILGSGVVEESAPLPKGQMIGGIITSVLAAGAIGTGIYFAVDAKNYEEQVEASIQANRAATLETTDLLTQVETSLLQSDGEQKAMLANILYASGAVLTVVSVILFLVRPESSDELFATQDLKLSPTFNQEGAGFAASFTF